MKINILKIKIKSTLTNTINNMKQISYYFYLPLISILINACTPSIVVKLKRPAEVNLKRYKKIAVNAIAGQYEPNEPEALNLTDDITVNLVESQLFEIVDRQNINTIMQEQNLGQSGVVDETSAVAIGKVIGPAAMIFGRIQNNNYKEDVTKGDSYVDQKGMTQTRYVRRGNLTYGVNLKLIDIETSKIIAIKSIDGSSSTSQTGSSYYSVPSINQDQLRNQCRSKVVEKFMKMVAPYIVSKTIFFEKDGKLPELTQALNLIKIQEWDEAIKVLEECSHKMDLEPKVKAKAIYNYGAILEAKERYEEALNLYKEAMKLGPTNKKIIRAIASAKEEKFLHDKLLEQEKSELEPVKN